MNIPSTPSATEMAQSIITLPYFLDPELQQQAMTAPQTLAQAVAGDRPSIYIRTLRLIANERMTERRDAWEVARTPGTSPEPLDRQIWLRDWNQSWRFNDERRQHITLKYPLAIRRLARGLMTIINRERFDGHGRPLSSDIAAQTERLPLATIMAGRPESPLIIGRHLKYAGYYETAALRDNTPLEKRTYPTDAQLYLALYPPVPSQLANEKSRRALQALFDISSGLLNRIVDDERLYPVIRMAEGRGQEIECFDSDAVASIRIALESIPPIASDETSLNAFLTELGSVKIGEHAVMLAGASTPTRKLGGKAKGRIIHNDDKPGIRAAYTYLTTKSPGEMSVPDIAKALDTNEGVVRYYVTADDRAAARPFHIPGMVSGHSVFPPDIAESIMARIRQPRKPSTKKVIGENSTRVNQVPLPPKAVARAEKPKKLPRQPNPSKPQGIPDPTSGSPAYYPGSTLARQAAQGAPPPAATKDLTNITPQGLTAKSPNSPRHRSEEAKKWTHTATMTFKNYISGTEKLSAAMVAVRLGIPEDDVHAALQRIEYGDAQALNSAQVSKSSALYTGDLLIALREQLVGIPLGYLHVLIGLTDNQLVQARKLLKDEHYEGRNDYYSPGAIKWVVENADKIRKAAPN